MRSSPHTWKGRTHFDFFLSPKATASWDVLTHSGSFSVPSFPSDGLFKTFGGPDGNNVGELICFAVDGPPKITTQVPFNYLSGSATVI